MQRRGDQGRAHRGGRRRALRRVRRVPRGQDPALLGPGPGLDAAAPLFDRLYAYLAAQAGPVGGSSRQFFGRGLEETDDPLYSHLPRFANTARCLRACCTADVAAAGAAPVVAAELRDPRSRDHLTRFTPLGRAQYLEITTFLTGYPPPLAGRPNADGQLRRGSLPLPRLPRRRVRRPPSGLRTACWGSRRSTSSGARSPTSCPTTIRTRPKRPYRAPIAAALAGRPPLRSTSPSCSRPPRIEQRRTVRRRRSRRASGRRPARGTTYPLTETEEMALVGVVSTMLLHEQFVARPPLAPLQRRPTKVVEAGEVSILPRDRRPNERAGHRMAARRHAARSAERHAAARSPSSPASRGRRTRAARLGASLRARACRSSVSRRGRSRRRPGGRASWHCVVAIYGDALAGGVFVVRQPADEAGQARATCSRTAARRFWSPRGRTRRAAGSQRSPLPPTSRRRS